jgi:hypothetical protein
MAHGEIGGSKLNNVLKAKEDLLKSPEELEAEKRNTIKTRVGKLDLNGLNKDDLVAQVCFEFYLNLKAYYIQLNFKH